MEVGVLLVIPRLIKIAQWKESQARKQNTEEKSSEVLERDSLTKKKRMRSQKVTCQGHFRPQVLGFHIVEL